MKRRGQRRRRGRQPIIVGDDRGFDEQGQPGGATEDGAVSAGERQGLRERQAERFGEIFASGGEITAQQQRRHGGVRHRVLRDGVGGTGQRLVELADPGILQARNYNEEMIVVRYLTLAALVLWIGVMVDARFGDALRRVQFLPYACGGIVVAGLFALKFLGPPPIAFVWRAAIVLLMLAIAVAATFVAPHDAPLLLAVNIGLGFILLVWYVRE